MIPENGMSEQLKPWAQEKINNMNKVLEKLDLGDIRVEVRNGVRLGVAGNVPEPILEQLSGIYFNKPKGVNNCYDVAEYTSLQTGEFNTMDSQEKSLLVGGDHCINFGQRLLVDLDVENYVADAFNILVIPLPEVLGPGIDSYTAFANKLLGGDWKYFGKEGLRKLREIQQEERIKLRAKHADFLKKVDEWEAEDAAKADDSKIA